MEYNSPPTTIEKQIEIISQRGININDYEQAKEFLSRVSYYRFCGYALHYEIFHDRQRTHRYKEECNFEDVVKLYEFDSNLRKLLFTSIETIEIAFRTQLCLRVSLKENNSHWILNSELFKDESEHSKFLKSCYNETGRSKEIFIENYKSKYSKPDLPAVWMLIEIVSFGPWSRLYKNLKDHEIKKDVAKYFKLTPYLLESWIHSLTVIRNQCAHHSRIWNRSLTIKPAMTRKMDLIYGTELKRQKRIIIVLDIIAELLKPLNKYEEFIEELNILLDKYSKIPLEPMGLKQRKIDIKDGLRI